MKKLPPYGRAVEAKQRTRSYLNIFVFAGDECWQRAQTRNNEGGDVLLLPAGDNPKNYRWPVCGQKLMLVWLDGMRDEIISFGSLLIESGASLVVAPTKEDKEGCLFFKPEEVAA